jgi:glycosyltransferase involved in cell wall biosynthesis
MTPAPEHPRVLMLGWEFPPYISGGLGTACFGLTRAMARLGSQILFVLPRPVDRRFTSHVHLVCPDRHPSPEPDAPTPPDAPLDAQGRPVTIPGVEFQHIPAAFASPYPDLDPWLLSLCAPAPGAPALPPTQADAPAPAINTDSDPLESPAPLPLAPDYGGDMIASAHRYALFCARTLRDKSFDCIHAHDWMTWPAGLALARLTGKPLVVHVHSTEFDRAGENIHPPIFEIERRGMHAAMRVVCVSHLTAALVMHRYGVDPGKIAVVYNGIDMFETPSPPTLARIHRGDKLVLFLGRITYQKGPEYFLGAARRVLEKMTHVKFVMAGSGDMVESVIRLARDMGIADKVVFTGFLRGRDVEKVFRMADVYVMPSVSEPFGIAPLEAIRHDVPVIISRHSGVAEVLHHALKVEPHDVDDIADKILAVLRHPPLAATLREQADLEARGLTWEGAAQRCLEVYRQAIQAVGD